MSPRRALSLFVVCAVALALPLPSEATRSRTTTPPRRDGRPQGGDVCVARLTVRQTQGASGCFIDERVTGAPGELRYPCAGGPATAVFRNGRYAGSVDAEGAVSLTLSTRFHYSDGCDWTSRQSITGRLDGSRLVFQYNESPVPGQRGCAGSCRATGDVEVRR